MENNKPRTYEVHVYDDNDVYEEYARCITLYARSNDELEKLIHQMVIVQKKACVILPGE